MKIYYLLISLALASTNVLADPMSAQEAFTDRQGGEFVSYDLAVSDPALCEAQCSADFNCRSWTYVLPGVQGTLAKCWLKHAQNTPTACAHCTSGYKVITDPMSAQEINTDRIGGEYSNFSLDVADPVLCETRCATDSQCQSWTYVNPGIQGPLAMCWLKNALNMPTPCTHCTSGYKP